MIYRREFEEPCTLVDAGATPDVPHMESLSGDADGEDHEGTTMLPLSPVAG